MLSKKDTYSVIWIIGAFVVTAGCVDALGVFLYGGKSITWPMLAAFAGAAICYISRQYISREQDHGRCPEAAIATRQTTLELDVAAQVQADRAGKNVDHTVKPVQRLPRAVSTPNRPAGVIRRKVK